MRDSTGNEAQAVPTPWPDRCADCGMPRAKLLEAGGYPYGQKFECGTRVAYEVAVTEKHHVVWLHPERKWRTSACEAIGAMRPVVVAACKVRPVFADDPVVGLASEFVAAVDAFDPGARNIGGASRVI